jgi:hypothetical protein
MGGSSQEIRGAEIIIVPYLSINGIIQTEILSTEPTLLVNAGINRRQTWRFTITLLNSRVPCKNLIPSNLH